MSTQQKWSSSVRGRVRHCEQIMERCKSCVCSVDANHHCCIRISPGPTADKSSFGNRTADNRAVVNGGSSDEQWFPSQSTHRTSLDSIIRLIRLQMLSQ